MSELQPGGYAGDSAASAAWENLETRHPVVAVDARRRAERTSGGARPIQHAFNAIVFNVTQGFAGRPDAARRRRSGASWKGEGWPWVQS